MAHRPRSRNGKQTGRLNVYLDEANRIRLQRYAEKVDLADGGAARLLILEGLDRRGEPFPQMVEREAVSA